MVKIGISNNVLKMVKNANGILKFNAYHLAISPYIIMKKNCLQVKQFKFLAEQKHRKSYTFFFVICKSGKMLAELNLSGQSFRVSSSKIHF